MSDAPEDLKSQLRSANEKVRVSEGETRVARERLTTNSIWAAVGGFCLFAIGGQWFPGYQLDSTAEKASVVAVDMASNKVLAHLCAERFMAGDGLDARVMSLEQQKSEWDQVRFLREGNWGTTLEGKEADYAVSEQCLSLIATRRDAAEKKTS